VRRAVVLATSLCAVAPAAARTMSQENVGDPCGERAAPIPPPPASVPLPAPPPASYEPLRGLDSSFDLGIGHLHAASPAASSATEADWFRFVELPVYHEPGGEPLGWLADGWWIPASDPVRPIALTTGAMVETGYEVASWIVYESREGWVRFRFATEVGWASLCHLSASDPPVAFESWEERFAGEGAGPLFFRTRERHALRRGPGTEFPRAFWLPGYQATELRPLEIRGDWMRIRAYSPPLYCAEPPPTRGIAEEGWVRWRDQVRGPWVWWFTRGC
jgi:hypothetical protein